MWRIDAKVSVESLLIYQNLNNATEFYVVYNYQVPTSLYPYKFKFDIQTNGVSTAIMTFLWDSDPIDPEEQKLKYRVNIINRIVLLFIKNQK
jgi:hypothetical protein